MFNLFRSRDRLVRIMLSALLLLVALSMVTYLIPNYGSGDRGPDSVVAEIGKDTITARDIQLKVQDAIRGRMVPTDMVGLYLPQIVEDMVDYRSMVYEAERLGLKVSDDETSAAIRMSVPALFPDGKFVGREAYASMLAQQNITIPEFETDIARRILVNRLTQIALEGIVVTPAEVEQEYRRRNEKVKIQYVKISPDQFKSEAKVTPAEMKAYFDKNPKAFPIPEKRSLAVLTLDQARLEQSIQPSEAQLRQAYDSDKEKFRTPERVQARHILLKAGKNPAEDAKIKAKAEDLLKQLKSGADFASLATKNSEDPGSSFKGGELGMVVRGQTVKPFEDVAFSLKPKQISDLVKTQFGYHIIQVLDHQEAHLKTFDEARDQLLDEFRKQRAGQMMQELTDRAQNALKKEPAEKVARDLDLAPPVAVENIGSGDSIPGIGANKDFQQSINGLQKGEVSQPVSLPGNRVVMAVVTSVTPTHPSTYAEAESQIRQMLESQKAGQLSAQRATDLQAKATAMNGDLEKAAKSMGLEVKSPLPFGRSESVEGAGTAGYFAQAFTKPDGTLLGVIPVPDARVVARVVGHLPADMSQFQAQRANLQLELKQKKASERRDLFAAGLRERLIKEGKVKVHQKVVNQLMTNYRG
jgi:peptidyl-prolyl cis-trans isomerase D